MNTRVDRIAHRQARMASFAPSPSPECPVASPSVDNEDDENDASSPGDDEMMTSQWLTLCHSWQKKEVVLVWE